MAEAVGIGYDVDDVGDVSAPSRYCLHKCTAQLVMGEWVSYPASWFLSLLYGKDCVWCTSSEAISPVKANKLRAKQKGKNKPSY